MAKHTGHYSKAKRTQHMPSQPDEYCHCCRTEKWKSWFHFFFLLPFAFVPLFDYIMDIIVTISFITPTALYSFGGDDSEDSSSDTPCRDYYPYYDDCTTTIAPADSEKNDDKLGYAIVSTLFLILSFRIAFWWWNKSGTIDMTMKNVVYSYIPFLSYFLLEYPWEDEEHEFDIVLGKEWSDIGYAMAEECFYLFFSTFYYPILLVRVIYDDLECLWWGQENVLGNVLAFLEVFESLSSITIQTAAAAAGTLDLYIFIPSLITGLMGIVKAIVIFYYFRHGFRRGFHSEQVEKYNLEDINTELQEVCGKKLKYRQTTRLKEFLQSGRDVDHRISKDGNTYLMEACRVGELQMVKDLLNSGANTNFNTNGVSALILACNRATGPKKTKSIIKLLIKHNANVNYQCQSLSTNINDQTALMTAAQRNNVKAVKLLLNAKADLSIKDKKGKTALDMAAQDVRELLKETV